MSDSVPASQSATAPIDAAAPVQQASAPAGPTITAQPKPKRQSRGSNFDDDEIDQLCKRWLHVSQNAQTGTGQKSDVFWESIAKNFNDSRPELSEVRTKRSLEKNGEQFRNQFPNFAAVFQMYVILMKVVHQRMI